MRETGYYFVKKSDKWGLGYYFKSQNKWFLVSHVDYFEDSYFDEINEQRIKTPDEVHNAG